MKTRVCVFATSMFLLFFSSNQYWIEISHNKIIQRGFSVQLDIQIHTLRIFHMNIFDLEAANRLVYPSVKLQIEETKPSGSKHFGGKKCYDSMTLGVFTTCRLNAPNTTLTHFSFHCTVSFHQIRNNIDLRNPFCISHSHTMNTQTHQKTHSFFPINLMYFFALKMVATITSCFVNRRIKLTHAVDHYSSYVVDRLAHSLVCTRNSELYE